MARKYGKKPEDQKRIAKAHISALISRSDEVFSEERELANRYVKIAKKIAMKFKLKFPRLLKRRICPHCNSFLVPGKNLRVRIHGSKIIYYCAVCQKYWRMPLNKDNKKKL